jgi:predicted DNA-binding transcriptional regulator YafY
VVKKYSNGDVLIRMDLMVNYELKSLILGYGSGMIIKKPLSVKEEILEEIENLKNNYLV